MRKPDFRLGENKGVDQLGSNCRADQHPCFVHMDSIQSLFFLKLEFQCSSLLLWLYRPVCVRPGRKLRTPVFLRHG